MTQKNTQLNKPKHNKHKLTDLVIVIRQKRGGPFRGKTSEQLVVVTSTAL